MRTVRGWGWAAAVCLLAGCGDGRAKPPQPEPPEAVFKRIHAAYLSADAKTQWGMLTARSREESEQALEGFKKDPGTMKKLAEQLHSTPEVLGGMGPVEFSAVVLRERMKDPVVEQRYRSFGAPSITVDGRRLRCAVKSSDGGMEWIVHLMEEDGAWKVDAEEEILYDVKGVGK